VGTAETAAAGRANHALDKFMPSSIRSRKDFTLNNRKYDEMDVIERAEIKLEYLEKQLNVPRLNDIYDYLWLAGRPMPPRPLNYQVASSRAITLMEDIHFHLVWEPGRIFLKPLPRYLLSQFFWNEHLICRQPRDNCSCFPNSNPQLGNPVAHQPSMQCRRRELYK
jgi:hypothetical protein